MSNETFTVEIQGIDDVCSKLDAIPRKLAIGKALTAAAVPIVQELDKRTPVSDLVSLIARAATGKTAARGTLKAHLMSVVNLDGNGNGGTVDVGYGKQGYIARFVEYGHRIVHGSKTSGKQTVSGQVPAHPFMRPAFEISAPKAQEAFEESIIQSLDEVTDGKPSI